MQCQVQKTIQGGILSGFVQTAVSDIVQLPVRFWAGNNMSDKPFYNVLHLFYTFHSTLSLADFYLYHRIGAYPDSLPK